MAPPPPTPSELPVSELPEDADEEPLAPSEVQRDPPPPAREPRRNRADTRE